MAEVDSFDNLLASRKLLKTSIENSRAIALALDKTGSRLAEMDKKLVFLEAAIRPSPSKSCTFAAVRDHISLALGPTVAFLKILDSFRELEKSLLSGPFSDFSSYLSTIRQLEEALKFLTEGSVPLALTSLSPSTAGQACNAASPVPGPILQKLQAIVEKLNVTNRLKNCISIFVEVRSLNTRNSWKALD
ncbi:hypothetical protein REPUB_Repub14bG0014800 [Reevesia pubescens]